MTWYATAQAACDYSRGSAGDAVLEAPRAIHRALDRSAPTGLIELPWTYVGSMARQSAGTEWGEVIAGTTGNRICGLRAGWWLRSIYKIEAKHINAAHRVYFQSCGYLLLRLTSAKVGAYTVGGQPVEMGVVVRHFAPPGAQTPEAWWAAASLPPYTYWTLGLPTIGARQIKALAGSPGSLAQPGDISVDQVDMSAWQEVVYLRDGYDAWVVLEPNFYAAELATSTDPGNAPGWPSEPLAGIAGDYYVELDAGFAPAFLLGGLTDAESYSS